jgi:uncharacterized repeat protein (TIGR03847 family)
MVNREIELDPVDFVTVGTVGPKGRRVFHLQAGQGSQLVTLTIEKQQVQALIEALQELLEDIKAKHPDLPEAEVTLARWNMKLRDPLDPLFRVSQMGLGYDDHRNLVVLVAQELVVSEEETVEPEPRSVRFWATREQMRALEQYAQEIVKQGRVDPKTNGHLIYYWT